MGTLISGISDFTSRIGRELTPNPVRRQGISLVIHSTFRQNQQKRQKRRSEVQGGYREPALFAISYCNGFCGGSRAPRVTNSMAAWLFRYRVDRSRRITVLGFNSIRAVQIN